MRSRAATKGRKLLFLAAVCLLPALLLSPTAEASRGVPAATLNLEPPVPHLGAEAPAAPRLGLFHLEDDLFVEILTGVEPEHHQALLEHRHLELLPPSTEPSAIQKTASRVSTSEPRLNVQKGKPLKPDLRWTVPFYAKARFYDPEVGRFLTEDPAEPDLTTPPSLHKYLYAYGNPTRYWDPYGLSPEDPDDRPIGNRIVDAIADSPVGEVVKKTTGAVGELSGGFGQLIGQEVESALRGDTPEDPYVLGLQRELGLNPSRPMAGAQPGRALNRRFASDAGEIVERGTSTLIEEAIYLGAGKAVSKTGKLLETVSPTNRRVRTGGGYVEVSDDVAGGAPLSGGFGRKTRVVVESSAEAKTSRRTLVSSSGGNSSQGTVRPPHRATSGVREPPNGLSAGDQIKLLPANAGPSGQISGSLGNRSFSLGLDVPQRAALSRDNALAAVKSARRSVAGTMRRDPGLRELRRAANSGDSHAAMIYGYILDARVKRTLQLPGAKPGVSRIQGLDFTVGGSRHGSVVKPGGTFGIRGEYRLPDFGWQTGDQLEFWDLKGPAFNLNLSKQFDDIEKWTGVRPLDLRYKR